jgi:uncharacterized cupredoxin-like copper-binding protein
LILFFSQRGDFHMRRILVGIVVAASMLVILTGCAPAQPETIEVKLTDFGVETPVTTFKVGQPYQFVITNTGAVAHEFVIMRPLEEDEMNMPGHGMEESLVTVTDEQLPPGATVTVDYTFTEPMSEGELEFACHVTGHYAAGMKIPITVTQ